MDNHLQHTIENIEGISHARRADSIPKAILYLLQETFAEWSRDNASQLGAALAYYTALSLAPLLVLIVVILSLVFGATSAEGEIITGTQQMLGQDAADVISTILRNAEVTGSGILATVISIGMLMFGASGMFGQLKHALNTVWELKQKSGRGVTGMLKERLISFTMVFVAGILLITSLMFDTLAAGLEGAIGAWLPTAPQLTQFIAYIQTIQAAKFLFSFLIFTFLFAFIYKAVPDAEIAWSDVWIGGAATSFLFTAGNVLIGIYLGRSSVRSAYGAAGSLVALLVWVYYSAQVFFLGAEFTQVYANTYGSRILPDDDAVAVLREMRTRKEIFEMMQPRLGWRRAEQEAEAGAEVADDVKIAAAAPAAGSSDASKHPQKRRRLAVFGGVAAVASVVAGVIFGLLRQGQNQNEKEVSD
jgi:membrane protein